MIDFIDNRAYTIKEVSEISGYPIYTLKRRIDANKLKTITDPGEKIMILGSEVKRFMHRA